MEGSPICNVFRPMRNILHYLAEWVYDTNYECLALEIVGRSYPASTYFRREVFGAVASPFNFFFAAVRFHRHAETLFFPPLSISLPYSYYFKFLSELANETRLSKWLEKLAPAADGPFISFVTNELRKTWVSLFARTSCYSQTARK